MDDNLREKATEYIQKNFTAILDTREFHMVPAIKLELIGKTRLNDMSLFEKTKHTCTH
jgi:hypothetical protein